MKIRSFKLGDLLRVVQIERASFGPEGCGTTTFLAHLLRDRKYSYVAEDEGGAVVGYVLVRMGLGWLGAKRGGMTSIAVDPACRRRGIGRALMAEAVECLRRHEVRQADLEVSVTNRAAQSLYEALGFRRARLLPHYYGPECDGMRMVLDLRGEVRGSGRAQGARKDRRPASRTLTGV
jgi:ribosomal-protein-alanine N-acetyltransferase